MKVSITGASHFVNRMFEACGNYQWAREFLKNSLEAGAKRVEFGIEWQAVEKHGIYRRTIIDNGSGMSSSELLAFFSTLGLGAKTIGTVHDNFGVGAKIAALPWNPEGLVVISYKDGRASMIKIVLEPESNEYELISFDTGNGVTCVIDPAAVAWSADEIDWGVITPEWAREHGTVIVLLGSEEYPDTILGNARADERDIKGLSVYLNSRFWDLSDVDVYVSELRSDKKNSWPLSRDDRDDARRPNNRHIRGARYYVDGIESAAGSLEAKGAFLLDEERVRVEWYLWKGERPQIHMYARKQGYIAVRYRDELFEHQTQKPQFRNFGVVESKVQQNLTIILDPIHYDAKKNPWGIHPDQSRNRLIFTGGGDKGVALPLSDWGLEFAEHLPDEIRAAIREARGDIEGSIENDEYRKRLQDKFGSRWTIRRLVNIANPSEERTKEASPSDETVKVADLAQPVKQRSRRKRTKTLQHIRLRADVGSGGAAVEMEVPVDVPKYRYESADEFEHEWHAAMWCPHYESGPTVVLNKDAPVIREAVKYHQDQYPDVHAEEIQSIVMEVYGEVAVAKVAHSQKLAAKIPEQDLDNEYRNEAALTVALMGLLAEDTLIAQRLGKLGRKKAAA
jgi:hypothetical protein